MKLVLVQKAFKIYTTEKQKNKHQKARAAAASGVFSLCKLIYHVINNYPEKKRRD